MQPQPTPTPPEDGQPTQPLADLRAEAALKETLRRALEASQARVRALEARHERIRQECQRALGAESGDGPQRAALTAVLAHLAPDCPDTGAPVEMELWCPRCKAQHLDEGEWFTKPHRRHLCLRCGHTWRPYGFSTVGVVRAPGTGRTREERELAASQWHALESAVEGRPEALAALAARREEAERLETSMAYLEHRVEELHGAVARSCEAREAAVRAERERVGNSLVRLRHNVVGDCKDGNSRPHVARALALALALVTEKDMRTVERLAIQRGRGARQRNEDGMRVHLADALRAAAGEWTGEGRLALLGFANRLLAEVAPHE